MEVRARIGPARYAKYILIIVYLAYLVSSNFVQELYYGWSTAIRCISYYGYDGKAAYSNERHGIDSAVLTGLNGLCTDALAGHGGAVTRSLCRLGIPVLGPSPEGTDHSCVRLTVRAKTLIHRWTR